MRAVLVAALGMTLAAAPAEAGQASGPYALALAGVVAEHDHVLSAADRSVVADLFAGRTHAHYPAGRRIVVRADKIVCRVSSVAITARSCLLTFGGRTQALTGAAANAVFATLAAAGVQSQGAAGSIFEAVNGLSCTLTPSLIVENGGGGADCAYEGGA
jgi:hypothetical protein